MIRGKKQADPELSPEALLGAVHSIAEAEGLEAVSFSRIASELDITPSGLFTFVELAAQPERRRGSLNRRRVIETALSIADDEGLDALTLRRIASELVVTPVALYRYVESKDDLLDAMADHVLGLISVPEERAPWQDFLRQVARTARTVLVEHPGAAPLYSSRPLLFSENARFLAEEIIGAFLDAGVSAADAVRLYEQFARLTLALTLLEAVPPAGHMRDADPEARDEAERRFRSVLESLSPRRFPALVEATPALTKRSDPEETFESGLDLVIAGLEFQVREAIGRKRGRRARAKKAARSPSRRSRTGSSTSSSRRARGN